MPRSHPTATRCAGGGSTRRTSASSGAPNETPHWPHTAFARPTCARTRPTATASDAPNGGPPRARSRTRNTRSLARSRSMSPTSVRRGPTTRAAPRSWPDTETVTTPPSSATSDRPSTTGCDRSVASMARRMGPATRHARPAATPSGQRIARVGRLAMPSTRAPPSDLDVSVISGIDASATINTEGPSAPRADGGACGNVRPDRARSIGAPAASSQRTSTSAASARAGIIATIATATARGFTRSTPWRGVGTSAR